MLYNNCINPYPLQLREVMNIESKLKWINDNNNDLYNTTTFYVNCGKCLLCIESWRRRWVTQMSLESLSFEKTSFLTLTYDNDNLNRICNTPSLDDHKKFMKRLRTRLDRLGYGKIRFVVVSERGKRGTCRVHYHYIIYGLGYGAFEKKLIQECWTFGFIKLKPVGNSFSYVVKYVLKGVEKENDYSHFFTYSRSVGLGFNYVLANRDFFLNQVKFNKSMSVVIGGVKRFLSKNLVKKVFVDDEEGLKSYYVMSFDKLSKQHEDKRKSLDMSVKDYSTFVYRSLRQKILNINSRRLRYG